MTYTPLYMEALHSGVFQEKVARAYEMLHSCRLCARSCLVDRKKGARGVCGVTDMAVVSSYGPHFGEESPLVGQGGSGTIFLTSCNLLCLFCQNREISHFKEGVEMSPERLGAVMLSLQKRGCRNINLVTPSHQMPFLLDGLSMAAGQGLSIPLVWNCGGYESLEALEILEGLVDVYMPDFKFMSTAASERYCNAPDYPEIAMRAISEMHRQVGDLLMDEEGSAERGLLVRHLVMPGNVCETGELLGWIARHISPKTYVNIMAQYRPCHEAFRFPEISRPLNDREYRQAVLWGRDAGLRLDQDHSPRSIMPPRG
jgi:putative pyruvate formate lyase activating enzyme